MKKLQRILACISTAAVISVSSGMCAVTASADWYKTSDGKYYYTLEDGDKLTGWQVIDGGKYYFNSKGYAVTGFKKIKGNTYYFNPEKKGKMTVKFKKIDGNIYYFGSDGIMRTGWKKVDGKTYYFNSAGKAATGNVTIGGKKYSFSSSGVLKTSSSSGTSKKTSSKTFANNAFGKSKYGDPYDSVMKNNDITTYVTTELSDGYYAIMFLQDGYIGSSAKEILVAFVFDSSDKLVAVYGIDSSGKSKSAFNKYAESTFGEAVISQNEGKIYLDGSAKYTIVVTGENGIDVFMETSVDDIETLLEAFNEISA